MSGLAIFDEGFGCADMTESINIIPNRYGRVNELGLFRNKGVTTTSVFIEFKDGVLNILPPTQRGGPASVGRTGKRRGKTLDILNYTHTDEILPDDIQNIRAFGQISEMETIQLKVLEKLETMRQKHDITLEHLRCGALQGQILDDEGEAILNLFDFFDVQQAAINFNTDVPSTDIASKCRDVKRHMEKNLNGEVMSGVYCLCSSGYFEALIRHKSVKEAYAAYQGLTPYREDMRKGFVYQGIFFEEYNAAASNAKGDVLPFIPEGEAVFFPTGTSQTFVNYFAPADFEETVNTLGLPIYAKQAPDKFNRKRDLLTQSNPMPICLRPNLLIRGISS